MSSFVLRGLVVRLSFRPWFLWFVRCFVLGFVQVAFVFSAFMFVARLWFPLYSD